MQENKTNPNQESLKSLNQIITTKRGEMTVKKIYKQIEMEEMLKILKEKMCYSNNFRSFFCN